MDASFVYNVLPRLIDFISHRTLVTVRRVNRNWMYLFRTVSVGRVAEKYQARVDKLTAFKAYLQYLPVQGSADWLAQRAGSATNRLQELLIEIHGLEPNYRFPPTIGGSEIPALLGEDSNKKPVELMRSKLGITKFDGNLYTNWGKMFEPIINLWTEIVFNCSLVESGSVPGLRNKFGATIQSYSPDGIGIVHMQRLREVLERENIKFTQTPEYTALINEPDQTDRVVLFEFKCPFIRKPNGSVPKQYQSQPQLGMSSLEIPEIGIFGDGAFRKCKITDFNFSPDYDFSMPLCRETARIKETPQCLGFIGVYEETTRTKRRGTADDLQKIVKMICEMTIHNKRFTKQDWYITTLIAMNYYDSLMDGDFEHLELTREERLRVLCNVVRNAIPSLNEMDRGDCYAALFGVIATLDLARETDNMQDLSFGIDLGYNRYDKSENARQLKDYELLSIESLHEAITRNQSLTGEEFTSLITHAQNNTEIKLYYPNRFCYQSTNPYASDLARMNGENHMDTNLRSAKQCKKWLWQNVKEFQQFCFDNGHCPIGVIPYKLMSIRYAPVYKEPNYSERYSPAIEAFQLQLETIRAGIVDPIEIDSRIAAAYGVQPIITKPIEPNTFDDEPLETIASTENVPCFSFDDLALIG